MIKNRFLTTIKEYKMFSPGETVLVAVSGGPDSVALLHLLHSHQEALGITLHVAHLNHQLRKGDAELDAKYVENMALRLGLPVTVEAVDVAALANNEGLGLEEAARNARYEFFNRLAERLEAKKIAVGHTADDNIETFLMRLLRGAGIKGLTGIPPKRGKVVRPLIRVWRREIEDYVGGLKLVPRRDHTNYESRYMRNSVRLKLIPQLKIYNLNIKEIILQTILLLTEDNLYLENQAAEAFNKVVSRQDSQTVEMELGKLRSLEPTIQRFVIRQAVEQVKGDLTQISFGHIYDVLNKLEDGGRWELHLPDGIYALGDKNSLKVTRQKQVIKAIKPFRYVLPLPGEIKIAELGKTIRGTFVETIEKNQGEGVAFIDYATLGKELIVRNKQPGDRFSPLGVRGSKKLQDYFVDAKIPLAERETVPIVESAGKIVWVAGHRVDERAKVQPGTKRIVRLEMQ